MESKELFYIPAAVIVPDKGGYHDAAEDEHHIHIGVFADVVYHVQRESRGDYVPSIADFLPRSGKTAHRNERGNERGDDQKYIEHGRVEQAVKVYAEHPLQPLEKGRRFKLQRLCIFHFYASFLLISST